MMREGKYRWQVFTKVTTAYGRKLYCHTHRNGTGGVVLGISTSRGSIPGWEVALAKPQDMKWYDNPNLTNKNRFNKSFHGVQTVFDNSATRTQISVQY